jgi:hypothetical protein
MENVNAAKVTFIYKKRNKETQSGTKTETMHLMIPSSWAFLRQSSATVRIFWSVGSGWALPRSRLAFITKACSTSMICSKGHILRQQAETWSSQSREKMSSSRECYQERGNIQTNNQFRRSNSPARKVITEKSYAKANKVIIPSEIMKLVHTTVDIL